MSAPVRYPWLLILLHWVMALAIILMLASGLSMEYLTLEKPFKFQLFQWHKSLGVLILMAVTLRILVRVRSRHQIPPLPSAMKPLEKKAAKLGHLALYLWMIALPLTGWLMVSSSAYGLPTIVFGWFEWPHIPGIAANHDIREVSEDTHALLAYIFIALIGVHVAAVIKHWLVDKDNLLPRMGIGK